MSESFSELLSIYRVKTESFRRDLYVSHRPNIKTILDTDILTLNDLVQNMNELEQEIFELENKAVKYWPPSMQDTLNNEYIVFEEFKNYCKKNL